LHTLAGLNASFLALAVERCVQLDNYVARQPGTPSSFERLLRTLPTLSAVRVFGCAAYSFVYPAAGQRLRSQRHMPTCKPGIHVGVVDGKYKI
jgi:hypothetical protein